MANYSNGKIYIIKSNETENVYIGSTCGTLKKRFSSHKSNYKRFLKGVVFRHSCSTKLLKYPNAYIELVEECPCLSKQELLQREGEIIKSTPHCVNVIVQGRTPKQYKEDNKEKLKQQSKIYRTKNKDSINQKYKEWYRSEKGKAYQQSIKEKRNVKTVCECGKTYTQSNKSRHNKTKFHQAHLSP